MIQPLPVPKGFQMNYGVRIQVEARGIKEGVCKAELTIPLIGWSKNSIRDSA
jgi:hypothetical protein